MREFSGYNKRQDYEKEFDFSYFTDSVFLYQGEHTGSIAQVEEFISQLDFKTKGMPKKISNIYSTGDDYRTKSNENDVQSPFVYVVNFADDMGFALVSGDTRMPPILAMIDNLPDF